MKHADQRFGTSTPFSNLADGNEDSVVSVGHFELRLLIAISNLGTDAFGSMLQKRLSHELGRDVAIGQLYLSLSKLQKKGMISYRINDPELRKGGRRKKVFHLETPGMQALKGTAALFNAVGVLQPS